MQFVTPRQMLWPLAALIAISAATAASAETWAEKLGYGKDAKVILFHADDIGMCYEANEAAKEALEEGQYFSCSAMAPCPWFNEFAAWCKEHPEHDCGLHITLNAEWKYYRWGPVVARDQVPGLVDKKGYLHDETIGTVLRGKPAEVEAEIRAQIEKALALGFKPSHLDSHMGTVFARPDFGEIYFKLAIEYGIPAFAPELSDRMIEKLRKEGFPLTARHRTMMQEYDLPRVDDFTLLQGTKTYDEKKEQLLDLIRNAEPGITQIIFHPSVPSETMKHITSSWENRGWEYEVFRDPEVQKFLEDQKIIQTNWKEIWSRFQQMKEETAAAEPGSPQDVLGAFFGRLKDGKIDEAKGLLFQPIRKPEVAAQLDEILPKIARQSAEGELHVFDCRIADDLAVVIIGKVDDTTVNAIDIDPVFLRKADDQWRVVLANTERDLMQHELTTDRDRSTAKVLLEWEADRIPEIRNKWAEEHQEKG